MCGFVGFTGGAFEKAPVLSRMTARIAHRGPDSEGFYTDERVALGFRRLSIQDLSREGDQPFADESGRYRMVFNGEIYNFPALREELKALGHTFRTGTDTEVLLHSYLEYGEACLDRLRGMFAFVIYDSKDGSLFGARDFFGIKPFYYTVFSDGSFGFASEIKSLLEHPLFVREVNREALRPYLTLQYSATEETFFRGVFKLLPSHAFNYQDGTLTVRRYARPDFKEDLTDMEEAAALIDRTLRDSVEAHRIADVPVAAFLSGGVDSSYVTTCMMPKKTYSVGFSQEKFDETNEAAGLSEILGIGNEKRTLTAEECFEAFPKIQYHMDEPQANPSSVPLWFLSKLAREEVTVVLSGEGADELFGGYEWYVDSPSMKKYKKKVPQSIRRLAASVASHMPYFKGHDFLLKCDGRPERYFVGQARVFSEKEAMDVLSRDYRIGKAPLALAKPHYEQVKDKNEMTKKMYLDFSMWMPGDILLKADKMSMAHSLELRVPYLDREMLRVAERLSPALRAGENGETKIALRRASEKAVPEEWAKRPKKGFPVPIRFWLKEEPYYSLVKEAFLAPYAAEFFDRKKILSLLDEHYEGKRNNARKIWVLYTFLVWYRAFFIDFDQYLEREDRA